MLQPSYYFENDFSRFVPYFMSKPHVQESFSKGESLNGPEGNTGNIHYVISGMAVTFTMHEDGNLKIVSYHGAGTLYPVTQEAAYNIEKSIVIRATTDMKVLTFTKDTYLDMLRENGSFCFQVSEWKSKYINLLLFESCHQTYNDGLTRLCNLLLLLAYRSEGEQIRMSQEELAEILGTTRVYVAQKLAFLRQEGILTTGRGQIEIADHVRLTEYCSCEMLEE